jgi:hypothetical protein
MKGEAVNVHTKNVYGRAEVQLHTFLISALNGTSGQLHVPPVLHPPEGCRHDVDRLLGWIQSRSGRFAFAGNRSMIPRSSSP